MLRIVDYIENTIMLTCFAAALFLGAYQVVLRYFFSRGYVWMEGAVILLTLWAALFGGSRAIRDGIHARVGILADSLPPTPRRILSLLVVALCILFCSAMFVFGLKYVLFMYGAGSRSLRVQIPTWQVFTIVPVFLAFFVLRYLAEFIHLLRDPHATLAAGVTEELSEEFLEEQLDVRDAAIERPTSGKRSSDEQVRK